MNPVRPLTLGGMLAAFLVCGCTWSLPKDLVPLDAADRCPEFNPDKQHDAHSETFELQCALGALRTIDPAPVHATPLGARLCFLLADRSKDQKVRERYAAEGVRWAEIALDEDTKQEGAVRYYLAVNLGLAIRRHPALALKNLKRLAENLEKACVVSPEVDQGGPLRVLGLLYLMAPPWPDGIGDGEKALELLKQSVEDYPAHPLNHAFYAQALWDLEEDDAKDKVEQHIQKSLELINQGDWGQAKERMLEELRTVAEEAEVSI